MKTIYLGLGSNLGEREENLRVAMQLLGPEIQIIKRSSIYESAPMYVTEQPKFLNMALEARTMLSPLATLEKLKKIEEVMDAHEHNKPRVIDLDILFYSDKIIDTPELTVPHPKIAERKFVLEPMAEIAPDFVHPILDVTIAELLERPEAVPNILRVYETRNMASKPADHQK